MTTMTSVLSFVVGWGLLWSVAECFAPPKSLIRCQQSRWHGTLYWQQQMTSSPVVQENVTSEVPVILPPDMEAYASGYSTVFDELPCLECKPSLGELPKDLVGTYFRSGPAMFSAGSIVPPKTSILQPDDPPLPDGEDMNRMVKHPFEGDGAVLAVTFPGDGTATTRFRYVRTAGFTNERKKGGRLYSAMDSTRALGPSAGGGLGNDLHLPLFRHHLQPGLNKKRKNTSNTRSVYWGKRLLTLWEGGLPYKIDALALSTEGRSQMGGVLKEQAPLGGKATYDSNKNRMLFYSNAQDAKNSELTLYEFNDKYRLVEGGGKVTVKLDGFAVLSDFAVTEDYAVFVQPPVTAGGMQFLMSKEPGKTLAVENKASLLHLIPRPGSKVGGELKSFSISFDGVLDAELQFCNAYEDGDNIVVDAIRSDGKNAAGRRASSWPWASTLESFAKCSAMRSLWRYSLNVRTGTVSKEELSDLQTYFGSVNPAVSGQRHRYLYGAVGFGNEVSPPQGIARFDCDAKTTDVWMPKEYEFCGEPMYASRNKGGSAEDDGYILSVLYNGKSEESELVVLKANNISAGPVSRIPLGMSVPHGLFGCFAASEEATWTAEEIERRSKLADKMESRGNMWNEVKSDFSGLGLRLDDLEEYFGDLL